MINIKYVKQVCPNNYEMIENYDKAINDDTQCYVCHHKLEIHEDYINSKEDLIKMNLYYNRPSCEFIFITKAEHNRIHNKARTGRQSKEIRESKSRKMKQFWETHPEAKQIMADKLSVAKKGKCHTEETKRKISETKRKMHLIPWNKKVK